MKFNKFLRLSSRLDRLLAEVIVEVLMVLPV